MDPAGISDAGPWAVLVFLLISAVVGVWTAFVKRIVVPGWLYDRAEARAEKAEAAAAVSATQAERNASALDTLAKVITSDGGRHAAG